MADMTPEDALAEFLDSVPPKESKCKSCSYAQAASADRAMIAFAKKKVSGETTQDWVTLHKFLIKTYDYPLSRISMRCHMKDCLELS